MKWGIAVGLCAVFSIQHSLADNVDEKPFAQLEGKTANRWSGWGVDNKKKAEYFNAERQRLGAEFEKELLKYVGKDLKRHIWCAAFLSMEDYLDGRTPMPKMALLLLQQGIILGEGDKDLNTQFELVRMRVLAAILSEKIGLHAMARHYKNRAEAMLKENNILVGGMPSLTEANHKIYEGIKQGK